MANETGETRCVLHSKAIDDHEGRIDSLETDVQKGNGKLSLKSRVTVIETYIEKQEELAKEKRADNRKIKLLIVGTAISIIASQFVMLKLA